MSPNRDECLSRISCEYFETDRPPIERFQIQGVEDVADQMETIARKEEGIRASIAANGGLPDSAIKKKGPLSEVSENAVTAPGDRTISGALTDSVF